jgi:hypothetical protein
MALLPREDQDRTTGDLARCTSGGPDAVHFPMVLLIRTMLGTSLWAPNLRNLALGAGTSIAVFLFGLAFSRLTEAHNDTMRARLLRLFTSPAALSQRA